MSVPETITFASKPVRVGQVTLRTSEEETRMAFMPPGPDGEPVTVLTQSRSRSVRREEIVAVRGPVAERMRVTFIEDVSTVETNGEPERTVSPLAGSTFEVERKSERAAVLVFDANGAPARFGVAAQVAGQYRHFGRMPPATSEVPVGPQKIGQSSSELGETLIASISRGATITSVEVPAATLIDIRPGPEGTLLGIYRVDVRVTGASNGSKVTMNLMGTLILRNVDGALLEIRLQGPVHSAPEPGEGGAVDAGQPGVPPGAGEFKLTQTMVYTPA
jgi:hypothetical protein